MPRLTGFGTTRHGGNDERAIDPHDLAGAASRVRMGNDMEDAQRMQEAERRSQFVMDRQIKQDERAEAREERMVAGAELDNEMKRLHIEQAKTDAIIKKNAIDRQMIDETRAQKLTKDLFDVDTKSPEAEKRFKELYRDYGDLIEDEKRFPSLKGQWDFNQKNFTFHRTQAQKDAADKVEADARAAQIADAQAKGLQRESVTVGGERYAKPDASKPIAADTYEQFQKDITAARKTHGVAIAKDGKPQANLPPEVQKAFEARGALLSKGAVAAPATAAAAVPAAATPAPSTFKEGDTRTKDGKTWKRDANGTWHPQP